MNAKFWSLAAVMAMGTACLDDEKIEEEEVSEPTSEPTSEPSEPAAEPDEEPEPTYAYITQNWTGSATVVPGASYEGTETLSFGVNYTAGTGSLDLKLVWNGVGAPIEAPADCQDCVFAFDLNYTFDAAASIDPNGEGSDASFSYAFGSDVDGANTLFYKGDGEWGPFLTDGEAAAAPLGGGEQDLNGDTFLQEVSFDGTNFTYDQGFVDFYYYY